MKKTFLYIVLIALMLTGQTCNRQPLLTDYYFTYIFYYNNKSDYNIDIIKYEYRVGSSIFSSTETTLQPGVERKIQVTLPGKYDGVGKFRPYCHFAPFPFRFDDSYPDDSLRIYFNKGKSDERYVTYKRDGIKPRDIRNHEEYVYEGAPGNEYFRYTFTNEDYNNAKKYQNATPNLTPPVPDCDNRPPDACVCYSSRGLDCVNKCK